MNKLNNKNGPRNQNASKGKKVTKLPAQKIVKQPINTSQSYRSAKPQFSYSKNGDVIISRRERCGIVTSNVGGNLFKPQDYRINAANSALFPWLSGVAKRYESYRFKSLSFEFRTKTTTQATGDVTMAVEYDLLDKAPTTTISMENWDDSCNGAPWQNFALNCKASNLSKRKTYFTKARLRGTESKNDLLLSDTGVLYVAVEGSTGSIVPIGYLYACYTVELLTPDLSENVADTLGGHFQSAVGASITDALGVGNGTVPVPATEGTEGIHAMLRVDFMKVIDSVGAPSGILGVKFDEPGDYYFGIDIEGSMNESTYPKLYTNNNTVDQLSVFNVHGSSNLIRINGYLRLKDIGYIESDEHCLVVDGSGITSISDCHMFVGRMPFNSAPFHPSVDEDQILFALEPLPSTRTHFFSDPASFKL